MNTLHFKYAVEVAKTGSITQAAENLYMAQPNLSKAMKELEETLGITIFRRTPKGVAPTRQGEEFLVYARKVLTQIERMENLRKPESADCQKFSLCISTGSYIAHAFARFVAELSPTKEMDIRMKEINSLESINSVSNGEFNLGVVRVPGQYDTYFQEFFDEKDLHSQLVWESEYRLLISREHPLAQAEKITYEDLAQGVEITHDSIAVPYLQPPEGRDAQFSEHDRRKVRVHQRSSRYELLSKVPGSYMWASAVPEEMLTRYGLAQRRCQRSNPVFRDYIIYPKDYTLTGLDRQFIDLLYITKNQVAFEEYR